MSEPALGVLEIQSVARGVVVCDAMVKRAPVRVLQNHPISPGKHLVIAVGGVAEVDEAMGAGAAVASGTLVDRLFLPQADAQLAPLIARGAASPPAWAREPSGAPDGRASAPVARAIDLESIAVVETFTVCACIVAADAAAKAASVTLVDMRLGQGLGGKAFFTISGDLESVEASVLAARAAVENGLLVGTEIIARPHADLLLRLMW